MTDEELIRCFEAAQAPPGGFHHREHVRVAGWYARRAPWLDAIERFRSGLLRFAAAQGAAGKYHETITIAFMLLVCERTAEAVDQSLDQFATCNPDLRAWTPSILDRYYRADTLAPHHARASFVCPDREEGRLTGASELAHGSRPRVGRPD